MGKHQARHRADTGVIRMVLPEGQVQHVARTGVALTVAAAAVTGSIAVVPAAQAHHIAPNYTQRTVDRGDYNDAVRLLQSKIGVKVDGKFGPVTEGAVKALQKRRNIKVDGVVGPITWGAILGPGGERQAPVSRSGARPAVAQGKAAIVAFARAQIGEPYVWGATGPNKWDCSGLTQAAYAAAGIKLPRVSRDQARVGTAVSRSAAQPGDLVVYPGHVAIYSGGNKMIAAPRPGQSVKEREIYGSPTFRRIG